MVVEQYFLFLYISTLLQSNFWNNVRTNIVMALGSLFFGGKKAKPCYANTYAMELKDTSN